MRLCGAEEMKTDGRDTLTTMSNRPALLLNRCLIAACFWSGCSCLHASIGVTLAPGISAPQPVGTLINWTAAVTDTVAGSHEFQFRVTAPGASSAAVVRDYNLGGSFAWTPSTVEGAYQISVTARNTSSGDTAQATQVFAVTSRLVNHLAAVNPTTHPLVALFSAPPCQAGNLIRVRFSGVSSLASQTTNSVACNPAASENFYIAGMLANTQYKMHYEILTSGGVLVRSGADFLFTTGTPTVTFPVTSTITPATSSTAYPLLLHDYLPLGTGARPVPTATDLNGNVLWYYPLPVSLLTRTELGGNMFVIYTGSTDPHLQLLREIDLAGNVVLETNVNRINQQLTAAGKRPIAAFHHEARRLSNGYIAVLGSDEILVTDAQGGTPSSPVDVLGAQVIVLDRNLQLVWSWDAFDHLDINRPAVLGETCKTNQLGCPIFRLASVANDWLHANSIQETPDGSLLVSLRHQDWLVKIDYAHGTGSGNLIWRMGAGGDFSIVSADPCPWFSHQHDANFQQGGMTMLSLYDNNNTRRANCNLNGNSRGYVLTVDEANRTVSPVLLFDLGGFSVGLGTAERLSNGNYHFESGWILPGGFSRSTEVTAAGGVAFEMQEQGITYRSYRMGDLYTPAP